MSTESDAKTFFQSGTVSPKVGSQKKYEYGVSVEAVITPLNSGMGAEVRITFEPAESNGGCASVKRRFINDTKKTLSQFIEKEIIPELLSRINTVFYRHGEAFVNKYQEFVLDEIGLFYQDIDKIRLP